MCGIVGGVQREDIYPFLIEGLKRLEYRGYDSAGLSIVTDFGRLTCIKKVGKVANLEQATNWPNVTGGCGIAHTRWATHGKVTEQNAHPHIAKERIVVVHNGIIDDFEAHRSALLNAGIELKSETDSEVIPHLVLREVEQGASLTEAVHRVSTQLAGNYSFASFDVLAPGTIVVARKGCPVVIGLSNSGNFFASDTLALARTAGRAIYLKDGDVAELSERQVSVIDSGGNPVNRDQCDITAQVDSALLGGFDHYMLKEIFEQPAIATDLASKWPNPSEPPLSVNNISSKLLEAVEHVHIISCGSSHHAALLAELWFEKYCQIPCSAFIASEYRYNSRKVPKKTLIIAISQSGETADTLGALEVAKDHRYLASIAICNSPESSLTREVDSTVFLNAGKEIGVASTKAFVSQLIILKMLALSIAWHKHLSIRDIDTLFLAFRNLDSAIEKCISLSDRLHVIANEFKNKRSCLFIGRGEYFPIAMEGALKLKEISYIHAEAYPAGELKHGPLALVDKDMPTIVLAPQNSVLDKIRSNIEEIKARNGHVYIFTQEGTEFHECEGTTLFRLPKVDDVVAPIVFTIALQLLSYHVALLLGMDVDRPRNLAKAVTVE